MKPAFSTLSGRGGQCGQALAEFALVSLVLALFIAGTVEFGLLYGHKLELGNAARAGARWAAAHPTAWSGAASPASDTVQGQVLAAGGTSNLPNDDSHLTVEYLDTSSATPTMCGYYSAAAAAFVAQGGYTQATCVKPGNLARVTVKQSYPLITSLLGGLFGTSVSVSGTAAVPVMT